MDATWIPTLTLGIEVEVAPRLTGLISSLKSIQWTLLPTLQAAHVPYASLFLTEEPGAGKTKMQGMAHPQI